MKRKSLVTGALFTAVLMVSVSLVPVQAVGAPKVDKGAIEIVGANGEKADGLEIVGVEEDGDRMILRIRNRTPFICIVYIYGRRVGWLKPFRTGLIRGLRRGFHRIYAHSRWGSFYWGPRSTWVPGTWSLYR